MYVRLFYVYMYTSFMHACMHVFTLTFMNKYNPSVCVSVCVRACACVCVCVCETERETKIQ